MFEREILYLLNRIEWQGDETHYVCPSCRASQMHGHMVDCELRKLQVKIYRLQHGDPVVGRDRRDRQVGSE